MICSVPIVLSEEETAHSMVLALCLFCFIQASALSYNQCSGKPSAACIGHVKYKCKLRASIQQKVVFLMYHVNSEEDGSGHTIKIYLNNS